MNQVHKDFSCPKYNKVKEEDKKAIEFLEGHSSRITAGLISSDKEEILTAAGGGTFGDTDNKIRVWSIKLKKQTKILKGHQHKILALSLSPNKEYLFSGDTNGTLIIWDYQTYSIINKADHGSPITKLYYLEENSQVFVIQSENITLYQLEKCVNDNEKQYELTIIESNKLNIHSFNINQDLKQYNICSLYGERYSNYYYILIFDCYTNEKIAQFTFNKQMSTNCLIDSLNNAVIFGFQNEITFWDYAKGLESFKYSHKYPVHSVFFSDNQTKVVSCTLFSTQIWDNIKKIQLFFIDSVGKILWVPEDLDYLLTCRLKNVGLYSFADKKYKDLFKTHNSVILSAYSIESKNLIVTLGVDNYVKIWDSISLNLRSQIVLDKYNAGLNIYPSKCCKYLVVDIKGKVLVMNVESILGSSKDVDDEIEMKASWSENYVDSEYDRNTYSFLVGCRV